MRRPNTPPRRIVDELADEKYPTKLKPSTLETLRRRKDETGLPIGTQIRDFVEKGLLNIELQATAGADRSYRAPILFGIPCGPFEELLAEADHFTLSEDVADELGVRDGDFLIRVSGISMDEAGIPDGCLVLVRPLKASQTPLRGQITLFEITERDGIPEGTLKRFDGWEKDTGRPRLLNGAGEEVELSKTAVTVTARATALGVISRL